MLLTPQHGASQPLGRPRGYCGTCNYNLTGTVSDVCPECGTSLYMNIVPDEVPFCLRWLAFPPGIPTALLVIIIGGRWFWRSILLSPWPWHYALLRDPIGITCLAAIGLRWAVGLHCVYRTSGKTGVHNYVVRCVPTVVCLIAIVVCSWRCDLLRIAHAASSSALRALATDVREGGTPRSHVPGWYGLFYVYRARLGVDGDVYLVVSDHQMIVDHRGIGPVSVSRHGIWHIKHVSETWYLATCVGDQLGKRTKSRDEGTKSGDGEDRNRMS
jgi:hypothetical protein